MKGCGLLQASSPCSIASCRYSAPEILVGKYCNEKVRPLRLPACLLLALHGHALLASASCLWVGVRVLSNLWIGVYSRLLEICLQLVHSVWLQLHEVPLTAVTLLQHDTCLPVVVQVLVCLPATAGCGNLVPVNHGLNLLSSGIEQGTVVSVRGTYARNDLV